MAFKRKRTYAPRRGGFKKRRTLRRRRFNGRAKSSTRWTGGIADSNFRSRKITRSKWKKMLWDSTLQEEHYRSIGAQSGSFGTPATLTTCQIFAFTGDDNGVSVPWNVTGGLQHSLNLTSNVVMRGGMHRLTVTNDAAVTTPMMCMVYGMITNDSADFTTLPTSAPIGWEPTVGPDFNEDIGRIVCNRSFVLGNQDSVTISYRRSIKKINISEWIAGKRRFFWIVCIHNLETSAAQNVTMIRSYNTSFCGSS